MAKRKDLTTTSLAMLGLLALRPWTTYELAQQMERSLRNFWPRARSKLYEEPKHLVAHGLAVARREQVGRRPRTVYAITPAGREALREWLRRPGAPPALEYEAILKVFLADQGTKDDLLAQIRHIRAWAEAEQLRGQAFLREYATTGGPFPGRLGIIALMVSFLTRIDDGIHEWAAWAEEEVSRWPDVHAAPDKQLFQRLLEKSERHVAAD
ncbi:MAG: PadR family transcriptional regulator [SAR202 cluster bacterium]|nr:PadR family transcriptional regulator [SAR202 cluster bacterium]